MNIAGVEIMIKTLKTKDQRDWFNNFKHEMHQSGILNNGRLSSSAIAILLRSVGGCEWIEADGEIWPVKPDDNFKKIFGLNPVKSGTTHQHLAQEKGEGSNKVPEQDIELGFYNYKSFPQMFDEFGDGGRVSAALRPLRTNKLAHMNHALTVNGGGIPNSGTENMNYVHKVRSCLDQLPNHKEEGEGSNKMQEQDIKLSLDYIFQKNDDFRPSNLSFASTDDMGGGIPSSGTEYMNYIRGEIRGGRSDQLLTHKEKDKLRYICEVFKMYDEVGDGGVFYIGGTSGSSTENMNYGRGEVRGHLDRNHIRKNHFASDDEELTEAMQKSTEARQKWYDAAMNQNIDNKKVNYEHVVDMPKGPDHGNTKEQANGLFRLCEVGLANTVSLMGSNPPPWATAPASQRLLGFSGAANAVGYVGTTAALSLRYTKPGAARIFANIGPIGCAWGVIMGFTSYLPGEFQWLGYVAAVVCTLAVLLANY